jgi:WD40 repeat protein
MSIDEFTLSTIIDIDNIQTKYDLIESVFYDDDQYIFACSFKFDTILIDINTEKVVKTFTGSRRFLTISPDGKLMCSGSSDNTVKIWNITTGECIKTLGGHESVVRSVSFSPNGNLICSGSSDNTVKIWNITTGECIKTLKEHKSVVRSVSFSPNGDLICSGSSDNTVKIWNITNGECIKTFKKHTSYSGLELGSEEEVIAKFSPVDNNIICSASTVDRRMKIWNKEEEKEKIIDLYDYPRSIHFSKNGKRICCSLHNNKIMIIETLEELRKELKKIINEKLKIIEKKHFYVHEIRRIIYETLEEIKKSHDGKKSKTIKRQYKSKKKSLSKTKRKVVQKNMKRRKSKSYFKKNKSRQRNSKND